MPADFKDVLQNLIDSPRDSDPWQVMLSIHSALADRATPVSLAHPLIGPALETYKRSVDSGLASELFKSRNTAQQALAMTSDLAKIYLPVFKKFASLGKARKSLEKHLSTLNSASAFKDAAPDFQHWAVRTAEKRPDFSHPAVKTKFSQG